MSNQRPAGLNLMAVTYTNAAYKVSGRNVARSMCRPSCTCSVYGQQVLASRSATQITNKQYQLLSSQFVDVLILQSGLITLLSPDTVSQVQSRSFPVHFFKAFFKAVRRSMRIPIHTRYTSLLDRLTHLLICNLKRWAIATNRRRR